MTATIDDIAKTLGEFEALAQKTGEWDGADPVEFSADGITWLPVWVPTALNIGPSVPESALYPTFARATVRRKGVATPTTMVVAWAESVPADDDWRQLWERKPMKLFGSFALRSSIRHAFRDVVGDLTGPDEDTGDPWAAPAEPRDWAAELEVTLTPDAVHDLHAAAKAARAMTPQLESAFRARLKYVREGAGRLLAEVLAEPAPELSPEEAIKVAAFFDQEEKPTRPAPRDHLPPANRAARRAKSRKGRR